MPRLLIVKTGDAFPEVVEAHGDFEALFQQALARAGVNAAVFDAHHEPLPALEEIDGLYITGSHAMVSDAEPWSEAGRADALLGQLPEGFPAQLTHAQAVLQAPPDAVVLARNAHDPHQALRYGPRQWSVQFHPEFTPAVMRAYLTRQVSALRDQGQDPEALMVGITTTPEASSLLARFAEAVAREAGTA